MSSSESEYVQSNIISILSKIEITQESITSSSSLFLRIARSTPSLVNNLVQDWMTVFSNHLNANPVDSNPNLHSMQALLFLANDVIQNSRQKNYAGVKFIEVFQTFLPSLFTSLLSLALSPSFRKEVAKVLNIWKDRKVYPEEFLNEYIKGFQDNLPEGLINVPGELINMAISYRDLQKFESKTVEMEKGIKKNMENIITIDGFNENKLSSEMLEFKRTLDAKQKYRGAYLKNLGEGLKNLDKGHGKMVFHLKNVCKAMGELEEVMNDNLFDELLHEESNLRLFDSNSFETEFQTYRVSSTLAIETSTIQSGKKRKNSHIFASHKNFSNKKLKTDNDIFIQVLNTTDKFHNAKVRRKTDKDQINPLDFKFKNMSLDDGSLTKIIAAKKQEDEMTEKMDEFSINESEEEKI